MSKPRGWGGRIGIAALVILVLGFGLLAVARIRYQPFSIASESMEPSLRKGEVVAVDRFSREPQRGQIAAFRFDSDTTFIFRIAALAGDSIAMHDGVVILNGQPVQQRPRSNYRVESSSPFRESVDAARRVERFPGETMPHAILDEGMHFQDNYSATLVPQGYVFVLGDNRDNAMDSRFPRAEHLGGGPGLVPVSDLVGTVDHVLWSPDPARRFKSIEQVQALSNAP